MSAPDFVVERLADLVGIPPDYVDAFGERVPVDLGRRRAMLGHLGFPAETAGEAADSLARAEALREGLADATIPVRAERPVMLPVRARAGARIAWRILHESGEVREGRAEARRAGEGSSLPLPTLPLGYHRLRLEAEDGAAADVTLIAAPPRCWTPGWMREGGRLWGLAAQVYALRSAGNAGIGSYGDVRRAVEGAAPLGASFLGLSPVHALFGADRTKVSPYSPSSRLFLETLHIDPTALPGFEGSDAARLWAEEGRAARVAALREAALVDHAAVWAELSPVLEAAGAARPARDRRFDAFRREAGEALEAHATFEALSERFRREGRWWLGDWPEEFRRAGTPAVRAFAQEHADRVAFHAWLQYVADGQLAAASEAAKRGGMAVGLYRDLAVGSDRGGSELWSNPERFGATLSVGAPPDLLAPQGQDWGLPPLDPVALERDGLAAFRALVAANMRHAGAVRIDHAFQLQRLYLIPVGGGGAAGAYVQYPFEAMLAVLRLESHRAKALVIAEDLGTAPEGFSDAIMRSGVLSYRVLFFEKTAEGGFKRPAEYPRDAMTVATTHDLPTLAGWWRGLDTDLRQTLDIYGPERADKERAERVVERARFAEALAAEGLLPSPEPPESVPAEAALRFLARTPAALQAVQYEDVLGAMNQPNMPGTTEGHPNWRRKLELDLDAIAAPNGPLPRVAAALAGEGRGPRASRPALAAPPPTATYRLQFHAGFTFDDAVAVAPYLARLGVSHVYASPIFKARPGSTHGYDIVDHAALNPELGGEGGFYRFSDALRRAGLGLILDIVPNHMGVGGSDNAQWLSTLEWGALSPASSWFDVDWERLGAHGRLVVPVLGDRYGDALESGKLRLAFDEGEGSFAVRHYDDELPLSPLTYPLVLDRAMAALDGLEAHGEVIAVSDRLRAMAEEAAPERRAAFPAEAEALKRRLADAVAASPELKAAIERAVAVVNGVPGLPESFGTLHRILEMQAYRPAHWRVAASDINYRRFFDVNGLAGLRVENPEVFRATHDLVFRLVREGRVQGLRIDHVDGLADPEGYLRALQAALGPGFYVVVEKILEPGERLRPWPIAGTTGYEALNQIDGLLVDGRAEGRFDAAYRGFTGERGRYFDLLRAAKTEIVSSSFASELEVLTSDLKRIADADRRTRDYTVFGIRVALTEIVARFPVYRSYITDEEPDPADVELIEEAVAGAKKDSALPDRSVHDFAAAALLGRVETEGPGRPSPEHVARFRRRFQQLTGPVMAKALEDTLFYRFNRLLALNEVGGDPHAFGLPPDAFHRLMAERAATQPDALTATATHDTKRGEDARGRLLALTEAPGLWEEALGRWRDVAGPELDEPEGEPAPDANDQVMILQALLGAWPFELLERDDEGALASFRERFAEYLRKALRESKRRTSWVSPDEAYEGAALGLVERLLAPGSAFLASFRPLAGRLAEAGIRNGLVRTALKCTLPGVPDVYQGTELHDLSLVDPDNRRPVDYAAREAALDDGASLDDLKRRAADGRLKQRLLHRILTDRRTAPELYANGGYRPLAASGPGAERALAFERSLGPARLAVAVARLSSGLGQEGAADLGGVTVAVPPGRWRDVATEAVHEVGPDGVAARELFAALPVAVLRRTDERAVPA